MTFELKRRARHMHDSWGVSIITGGGRGIGRSITLRLARESAVIPVGRNQADLMATCETVIAAGGEAIPSVGDVADPTTAERAVQLAREKGWAIRNLICNAGMGQSGPTHTFDSTTWTRIFDVNVHGSFYFVRACLPAMLDQGKGVIVLMSSTAGVKGYKYIAAYTASKHALVGLARSLAQEYGKRGIVTVPVCPGFVESPMTRKMIQGLAHHRGISVAEAEARIAEVNPQRRILPAEEVAEMVATVCSGVAPSLSGHPLILSGGE
jgi:NAD(P)-dependent dehydrogenase (short-subunit alcohol dehydrogenase family)